MGKKMDKYLFYENAGFSDAFVFVFLCGTAYKKNKRDKRNVLYSFIESLSNGSANIYRPIILENNFMFSSKSNRYLKYDDINLGNLYQVESLVNNIADKTIIIQESISTGAETGLFLGNKMSWGKMCLMIPDPVAVEEDRQGKFLKLAIRNMNPGIRVIQYYPSVQWFNISNKHSVIHTYFNENRIGEHLSKQLIEFLKTPDCVNVFKLTSNKRTAESEGIVYYKDNGDGELSIEVLPQTIMRALCCLFSVNEYQDKWINKWWDSFSNLISDIYEKLKIVFINTVTEKSGKTYEKCVIKPMVADRGLSVHNYLSMCLYLLRAAKLIEIKTKNGNVYLSKKSIQIVNGHHVYFYDRYKNGIKKAIENRIG